MPIPAWLQVTPEDYLSAAQSGLQLGLSAARMYQEANEFNTRLAEASKENQMDRQAKMELAERKFQEDKQNLLIESEYKHQVLSANQQKAEQAAAVNLERAKAGIAHWNQMQKAAELRAQIDMARLNKPAAGRAGLSHADMVADQDLRSKISMLDKQIASTGDEAAKAKLQADRSDLVNQRKTIGLPPPELKPVMGKRAMMDEASMSAPGAIAAPQMIAAPPAKPAATAPEATSLDRAQKAMDQRRVSVVSPDGKTGTIPRSQLDAALDAGYTVSEDANSGN